VAAAAAQLDYTAIAASQRRHQSRQGGPHDPPTGPLQWGGTTFRHQRPQLLPLLLPLQ